MTTENLPFPPDTLDQTKIKINGQRGDGLNEDNPTTKLIRWGISIYKRIVK